MKHLESEFIGIFERLVHDDRFPHLHGEVSDDARGLGSGLNGAHHRREDRARALGGVQLAANPALVMLALTAAGAVWRRNRVCNPEGPPAEHLQRPPCDGCTH